MYHLGGSFVSENGLNVPVSQPHNVTHDATSSKALSVVTLLFIPLGWVLEVLCEVVSEHWLELLTLSLELHGKPSLVCTWRELHPSRVLPGRLQ